MSGFSTALSSGQAYTQTYATADRTHANPTGVAVAGSIPAGGTGAAAGGWDTAANRDTAIATIGEMKATVNNLVADMADLKQLVNALIDDLQAVRIVS